MNRSILVLIPAMILSSPVWSQNLIVNGDFQSGDTGFTSDYVPFDDLNGVGVYVITPDPGPLHGSADSYFDHTFGDESGLMMAVNGGDQPDEVVWAQTVTVDSGQTYLFQLWVSSWVATNPAELLVQINGVPLGPSFFAPDVTAEWQLQEQSWASDSATSATIEVINLSTIGGAGSGNDFALDDISLVADTDTVGGNVTGMSPAFVVCQNRTTGQTVFSLLGGNRTWDCEAEGLVVTQGDAVQVFIRGSAD